jgi:5-methylcytosine-specific restriction endonuclease McrA
MPLRRPCLACGRLAFGSYCRRHRPWTVSPSSAFGLKRSPATRRRVLERDGEACVVCGSTRNFRVHHLVRVADAGSNEEPNLVTLCGYCHLDAHQADEDAEIEEIGEDYMLYGEL